MHLKHNILANQKRNSKNLLHIFHSTWNDTCLNFNVSNMFSGRIIFFIMKLFLFTCLATESFSSLWNFFSLHV